MDNEEKNVQQPIDEQLKADKEAFEAALYAAPDDDEDEKPKKPKKKGKYGPISIIILVICVGVFIYSMSNILKLTPNDFNTKNLIEELKKEALNYEEEHSHTYNDNDNPEQYNDNPDDPSSSTQEKKKKAKLRKMSKNRI